MVDLILDDVKKNWRKLSLSKKPQDLSFLQISLSRGKRFNKGRLIYLIFEKGSAQPLVCAKICRDSSYESSLEEEYKVLQKLRDKASPSIAESVPRALRLVDRGGRKVMYESSAVGRLVNKVLSDALAVDLAKFKVLTSEVFYALGSWLEELYSSTRTGSATIDQSFVERNARPIVRRFVEILEVPKDEQEPYYKVLPGFKRFYGKSLPVVMTHGNLFPCNVLLRDDQSIGIIDWKFSQQSPLVLRDIYCFALHTFYDFQRIGVFDSSGIVGNFKKTFADSDSNWLSEIVTGSVKSLYRSIGIDEEIHSLLFPLFLMNEVKVQNEFSPFIELGAKSIEKDFTDVFLGLKTKELYAGPEKIHLTKEELVGQVEEKDKEVAQLMQIISAKDNHIKHLESFVFKVRRTLPYRAYKAFKNVITRPDY